MCFFMKLVFLETSHHIFYFFIYIFSPDEKMLELFSFFCLYFYNACSDAKVLCFVISTDGLQCSFTAVKIIWLRSQNHMTYFL